ncbi:MAG: formate/nitrite transporter family protein [Pseudomonadota bacterium]
MPKALDAARRSRVDFFRCARTEKTRRRVQQPAAAGEADPRRGLLRVRELPSGHAASDRPRRAAGRSDALRRARGGRRRRGGGAVLFAVVPDPAPAARSVPGKAVAIVFPVAGFVALGFEHSVANMYLLPLVALQRDASLSIADILGNLAKVTLGDSVAGGALVALVRRLVYLRPLGPASR